MGARISGLIVLALALAAAAGPGCSQTPRPGTPWHQPFIVEAERGIFTEQLLPHLQRILRREPVGETRAQAILRFEADVLTSPRRREIVSLLLKLMAHDEVVVDPEKSSLRLNRRIRDECARLLGLYGRPALEPVLTAVAEEGFPVTGRAPLVTVLGRIGSDPRLLPPLNTSQFFQPPTAGERQRIIAALIPFLSRRRGGRAEDFRSRAAVALGQMRAVEAVDALIALAEVESDPFVLRHAVEALGLIGERRALTVLEGLDRRLPALDDLEPLSPEAELKQALRRALGALNSRRGG